jgi:SAM-dependent methyltransferase
MNTIVQAHYNTMLAGSYTWISGGWEAQVQKNQKFFSFHAVTPRDNRVAIDLGAGCGFQSVPLARLRFSVTAVDFCVTLLEELRSQAGALPIVTVHSDILHYPSWAGRHPALIVCMGDTLTHLPGIPEVQDLVRQCFSELDPGGMLVLAFRDYSRKPDGTEVVIPVERGEDRIFLCKLEYHPDTLTVQDILYSRKRGVWERTTGKYEKIRIAPEIIIRMLNDAGFSIEYSSVENGIITVIARNDT